MHSADYAVARCPSVCPSVRHTPVFSTNISTFFHRRVDPPFWFLIKANSSNVGQLWAVLRKSENWGSKSKKIDYCGNVNDINKYFTSVVFDKEYSREAVLTELQCQLLGRDVAHSFGGLY